jgi:soluble lytic murein transglycosylase-like protein
MYIIPKMVLLAKKFLAILDVNSVILLNNTVYATDIETTDSRDYILNIIKLEEAKYSIPSGLLLALVKTESNLKPLALNMNGKSLFFNDKEKAIKAINKAIASGIFSIDIGIAQINYKWHGKNFTSVESMLSPELNIAYSALLLSKLKMTHGDWHKALRHYHSANSVHNQKYSRKVVTCWLGISEIKPNKYR